MPRDKLERTKDIVEIVAIVGAALWAAWVFTFKEILVPDNSPPVVTVEASAHVVAMLPDRALLQLTTSIKNVGRRNAWILGFWYNARFAQLVPAPGTEFFERAQGLFAKGLLAPAPTFRSFKHSFSAVEASGRLVGDGWWLDPGETMSFNEPIAVSRAHDLVAVELRARYATRPKLVGLKWTISDYGLEDHCTLRVNDIDEPFDSKNKEHERLRKKYGLTLTRTTTFAPIVARPNPAPSRPPVVVSGGRRSPSSSDLNRRTKKP